MRIVLPVLIVGVLLSAFLVDSYQRAKWAERLEIKIQELQYAVSQR